MSVASTPDCDSDRTLPSAFCRLRLGADELACKPDTTVIPSQKPVSLSWAVVGPSTFTVPSPNRPSIARWVRVVLVGMRWV